MVASRSPHILKPEQFLEACVNSSEEGQNIMCEIYQHEFLLSYDINWDPNPFMGDIQLMAFTSFLNHQIQWGNALSHIQYEESRDNLWVRGEPFSPLRIVWENENLLKQV